jgi:hypothetical protein
MTDEYIEDAPQEYEGAATPMDPIPVVDMSERRTPELASTNTWTIPVAGTGQPVQILTRTERRFKAKLFITALGGATAVVFNPVIDRVQGASPQGASYLAVGSLPDWESVQPLYAIAVGGTGATVAVQDERYL